MKEIWKDIKGYEKLYQISNLGRVKSLHRKDGRGRTIVECIRRPNKDRYGYLHVYLYKNSKITNPTIHRLVAIHYLSKPRDKYKNQVNHKSGIRENNFVKKFRMVYS